MNTSKKIWLIIIPLFIAAAWLTPIIASAQDFNINEGIVGNLGASCRETGNCDFCDFLGMFVVLQKVILSLFAGLSLIMILWATVGLITAAGNQEKISAGKKLITSTLLGIGIIFAGYFLVQIIYSISTIPNQGEVVSKNLTCSALSGVQTPICALTNNAAGCAQACPVGLVGTSQALAIDTYPINKQSTSICCIPAALSQSWWANKLGCPVPKSEADKDFCKTKTNGTACKIMIGKNIDLGKCLDKVCVSNCTTTLKDNSEPPKADAQCQTWSQCGYSTLASCTADTANCRTKLCGGDENRVCCRHK